MGARAMARNREVFLENKYPYRLCQDAVSALFPYITKRKIKCTAHDLLFMIDKMSLRYHELPSEDLKKEINEAGAGCVILYSENDGPIKDTEKIICLCHGASITVMVARELVQSLKLRYMDLIN